MSLINAHVMNIHYGDYRQLSVSGELSAAAGGHRVEPEIQRAGRCVYLLGGRELLCPHYHRGS